MDYFIKQYRRLSKSVFIPLGFLPIKAYPSMNGFYRISEDVLHTVFLKRWRSGFLYSIEFGANPICDPGTSITSADFDLSSFYINLQHGAWFCDKKSEESATECNVSLFDAVEETVLPFFAETKTCAEALGTVLALRDKKERARKDYLILHHMEDKKDHSKEFYLIDSDLFYFALKSKDYTFAARYLRCVLPQIEEKIQYFQTTQVVYSDLDGRIRRLLSKLAEYKRYLWEIEQGDLDFFEVLLATNEAGARVRLEKEAVFRKTRNGLREP